MTRSPARLRTVRRSDSSPDERADRRPASRCLTRLGAGAAVVAVLAVAGCGISDSSDNGSGPAGSPQDFALGDVPAGGAAGAGAAPGAFRSGVSNSKQDSAVAGIADLDPLAIGRAQIKKAQIGLRSDKVAGVVTAIETLATAQGGFIDSENTTTDPQGVAQASALIIRVPVDTFSSTVDQVSRLGRLESKKTTTVDVTGQVADVASRVSSAKESIAQLRVLFSHATKLGDIITLESELSARESDLEALEAQQRVLTAQTTLSTITVSVARETTVAPKAANTDDDTSGFLGGLRQGWDALVTAFEGTAHALGAVLPIGLTLTALGLLAWAAIRRLPRRASTSGSPRPAE